MIKKILVLARKTMKLTILLGISILLIICAVALFFKPIYSVSLNGEQLGYSKDKSKLQALIFDSYFDSYRGIVTSIRVVNGKLKVKDKIKMLATGAVYEVVEVGIHNPKENKKITRKIMNNYIFQMERLIAK